MNANDYLEKILAQQTFDDDDAEMKELRTRRKEIQQILDRRFSESSPSIRWGGSVAKCTMIREAYDGDMTCYFPHDETDAGNTLAEIYDNVANTLSGKYVIERKTSALRVKDPSTKPSKGFAQDLHIDVVPGRFTNGDEDDVFLHRTNGDKERLKTNLQVHIDHIRDSGVIPAIRLMKLWNTRNGIGAKTFVLELLTVKLLQGKKNASISKQLEHLWTELRDHAGSLAVEDPANPSGNDLKPILDQARHRLSTAAATTLSLIENSGWEAVFGKIDENSDPEGRKTALKAAAVRVVSPTKPWLPNA
ncbi:MAG TPA: nucleotidyltransferase [Candidatus Acidoferrales bacterium]|nr:nucleotidyltransferase [Candidatus Acidoferrales bacterium]